TSCTPSSISIRPASGCPCPTAPSTVRSTPVERCTSIPISIRRATTFSICSSVARSCMTTTIVPAASPVPVLMLLGPDVLAVNQTPFEASRLVDDAFEQPRNGVRSERALGGDAAHVGQDLLLPLRLIDLDAELLLQLADL